MDTSPVSFCTLGELKFGDKFVTDIDDVFDETEHLEFFSFAYDGKAMVASSNTDYVRGYKSGLTRNDSAIKLGH